MNILTASTSKLEWGGIVKKENEAKKPGVRGTKKGAFG